MWQLETHFPSCTITVNYPDLLSANKDARHWKRKGYRSYVLHDGLVYHEGDKL